MCRNKWPQFHFNVLQLYLSDSVYSIDKMALSCFDLRLTSPLAVMTMYDTGHVTCLTLTSDPTKWLASYRALCAHVYSDWLLRVVQVTMFFN